MLLDGQFYNTPLHFAAQRNQCEVAKILIAAGADLDAKAAVTVLAAPLAAANSVLLGGQGGWTPLFMAKYYKSQDIVKLLEAAGARYKA